MAQSITLSELTTSIGAVLHSRFGTGVWVVGEVSECKVNSAGHCYLSLVERREGASAPVAEIRAAIWSRSYREIAARFMSTTGENITSGMKLMMFCTVSFHSVYGLSLVINDIDPTYTLGESELLKRQTIARLEQEGVMTLQREQNRLPYVVQRLAVISSATAAGYEDFCKQIESSPYRFEVTLFEAMMQGDKTTPTVIAAMDKVLNYAVNFDAVVIIRGGGSASDLRWFDSYDLCYYISQFPLPVLTGIGHEKDVSVADMVAYHYFKTPTAVAAGLSDRIGVVDTKLLNFKDEIERTSSQILSDEWRRVEDAATEMRILSMNILQSAELKLNKLRNDVPAYFNGVIVRENAKIESLRTHTMRYGQHIVTTNEKRISAASQDLKVTTLNILNVNAMRLEKMKVGIPALFASIVSRECSKVDSLNNKFIQQGVFITQNAERKIKNLAENLRATTLQITERENNRLQRIEATLTPLTRTIIDRCDNHHKKLTDSVIQYASRTIDYNTAKSEYLFLSFTRSATEIVNREKSALKLLKEQISGHNPRRILSLGYSITTNDSGEVVKSASKIKAGSSLKVEFADGTAETTVRKINNL